MLSQAKAFTTYAWAFLVYLVGVIMFGAWVRITHSGAGCGDHWPTCHGEIIPIEPSIETMIEYTHRLTSGMCGIFGIALVFWAWRKFGVGRIFYAAVVTLIFIIFEGAIGAGLVLAELVEDDASVARAVVISLHLVNTLFLTGSAAFVAWWSRGGNVPSLKHPWSKWLLAAAALVIFTCMTGAVTALGDTLFPIAPTLGDGMWSKIRADLAPTEHFLVRLRVIHPFVAILTAIALFALATRARYANHSERAHKAALALMVVVGIQTVAGFVNIALAAPGWMQLSHLAIAQALWVILLVMMAEITGSAEPTS